MDDTLPFILVLEDLDQKKLSQVLKSCAAKGFRLTKCLTDLGIILGHLTIDRIEGIRSIPGISSVELDDGQCEIQNSKEA